MQDFLDPVLIDAGSMMYMSGAYDVLFLPEFLSNRLHFLRFITMTFLKIPSCSSGFIQDFLFHYEWIDVGSIMYMSGEAPFIVRVDSG